MRWLSGTRTVAMFPRWPPMNTQTRGKGGCSMFGTKFSTKKGMLGVVLAAVSVGIFWFGLPALGHETRAGQLYTFEVGFIQEPVFRGFPNAVDIFISRSSDNKPISKRKGD